jgi:hypothetical protein
MCCGDLKEAPIAATMNCKPLLIEVLIAYLSYDTNLKNVNVDEQQGNTAK